MPLYAIYAASINSVVINLICQTMGEAGACEFNKDDSKQNDLRATLDTASQKAVHSVKSLSQHNV
mgnify:CR=1 FL=1